MSFLTKNVQSHVNMNEMVNNHIFVHVYNTYVVVQFDPWFNFYFPLFLGMVMYDNQFKTKKNKN